MLYFVSYPVLLSRAALASSDADGEGTANLETVV